MKPRNYFSENVDIVSKYVGRLSKVMLSSFVDAEEEEFLVALLVVLSTHQETLAKRSKDSKAEGMEITKSVLDFLASNSTPDLPYDKFIKYPPKE